MKKRVDILQKIHSLDKDNVYEKKGEEELVGVVAEYVFLLPLVCKLEDESGTKKLPESLSFYNFIGIKFHEIQERAEGLREEFRNKIRNGLSV